MALMNYNRLLANQCKRRSFLLCAGFLTGLTVTSQLHPVLANHRFSGYPFSLGVASGDLD